MICAAAGWQRTGSDCVLSARSDDSLIIRIYGPPQARFTSLNSLTRTDAWASDGKVHKINPGTTDVLLPAVITCPTASEGVERDLANETNDLGLAGLDDLQHTFYASLRLTFFQFCHVSRGPVHEIHEIQCVFRNEIFIVDTLERFVALQIALNLIQVSSSVEQIPEHLVIGEWNSASKRPRMRMDAHKKYLRVL